MSHLGKYSVLQKLFLSLTSHLKNNYFHTFSLLDLKFCLIHILKLFSRTLYQNQVSHQQYGPDIANVRLAQIFVDQRSERIIWGQVFQIQKLSKFDHIRYFCKLFRQDRIQILFTKLFPEVVQLKIEVQNLCDVQVEVKGCQD